MPKEKLIFVSEGRCYLASISMEEAQRQKIFAKAVDFDLKEDMIKLH